MQKESDKSVEDTTGFKTNQLYYFEFRNDYKNVSDEIVVCGDDVVEEGGTIEDDSAFDFIGSTQYPQTP